MTTDSGNVKVKVIGYSRAELHAASRDAAQTDSPEAMRAKLVNDAWLLTEPEAVRVLAKRFSIFKVHRIKAGAPYRMTGGGTIGAIVGFFERDDGTFDISFSAHELHYDETLQSARELALTAGLDRPLKVAIDPQWLEEDPTPEPTTTMAGDGGVQGMSA